MEQRDWEKAGESCPECGSVGYIHERGCLELARIQRDQLREARAGGWNPDPGRWAAREAEIARMLASD